MPTNRKYKRTFRKKKKTNQLAKRVKKLETLTKNTVERSYRYNDFSMSQVTSSGLIKQDPFDLKSINTIQPPSNVTENNQGQRIGDRITLTSCNIQAKMKWADANPANTWCKIRVIIFKLSNNTYNYAPIAPDPPGNTTGGDALVQDILNLSHPNVGQCQAYYRKDGNVKYTIMKDRTYIIGNKLTDANQVQGFAQLTSQYPSCKNLNWTFRFKKGLNVEYDFTNNIRTNQLRMLVITENDSLTGAEIQPDIHFKTRINYCM